MTFSIVARSENGESWGVAVASKFLAVGSAVPAAVAGVGAIATQAWANVGYKPLGLTHLADGATAQVALDRLLEEDEGRDQRQVGIVDLDGNAATHTGAECLDWAGGHAGPGLAIQGNILAGPQVIEAMRGTWDASADRPFAQRLLAALRAGDDAGGDRRGRQSAAVLVVTEGGGYGGFDDVQLDLRVDDHPDPCAELSRLMDLHRLYFSPTGEEDRVPVDQALRSELDARASAQGHADFDAWVGAENFEMRVGEAWVDREVLEILRGG